ncbi:DUF6262 family protein [Kribbella sp. C-35]|uniref:DUF6262 family protein n=1 Tax=Kribbella sp. C-35 TaxID=2789276 RepID=UPI00397B9DD0
MGPPGPHRAAERPLRRHQDAIGRASRVLRAAEASGEPVTYANIAAAAGVSRSWLYTEPEIRAAIERLRDDNGRSAAVSVPTRQRASAASLVRRLEAAHQRNQDLSREVAELRDQLAAAHGELRAARRRPVASSVVDLSQRRLQD